MSSDEESEHTTDSEPEQEEIEDELEIHEEPKKEHQSWAKKHPAMCMGIKISSYTIAVIVSVLLQLGVLTAIALFCACMGNASFCNITRGDAAAGILIMLVWEGLIVFSTAYIVNGMVRG